MRRYTSSTTAAPDRDIPTDNDMLAAVIAIFTGATFAALCIGIGIALALGII